MEENLRTTPITREQYLNGFEFMRLNFPCSDKGHCEGCEIDFQSLLDHMNIDYSNAITSAD